MVRKGGVADLFWRRIHSIWWWTGYVTEEESSATNAMQVSDLGIGMVEGCRSDRFKGIRERDQRSAELKGG